MNTTAEEYIPKVPGLDFKDGKGWVAFIQARMGSTRLPGKALLPIGERSVISHVYSRVKSVFPETVVCIPGSSENDVLAGELAMLGAETFRWAGPEHDVLGRFAACFGERYNWESEHDICVVRVTADCPFLPPALMREVALAASFGQRRYCASFHPKRTWPKGYDVEAFSGGLLGHARICAIHPYDREHVTPWIQRSTGADPPSAASPLDQSAWRWTLDTTADYEFFKAVAARINCEPPHPTTEELLALLEREPELAKINT